MDLETYLHIDNIQTIITRCITGVFKKELMSPKFGDTYILAKDDDYYMAIPYYVSDKSVYAVRNDDTLEQGSIIVASISAQSEDRTTIKRMAEKNAKMADFFSATLRAIRNASN